MRYFLPGKRRRLMSLLISIYKTAGYCLDDCFASCENIVWISKFYGERRHGCVFSFLYLNLSMVVIDSLKLIFPCDVFVGVSGRIQCDFFLPRRRRRLMSLLISIYKTAGYCFDDCFASCESIVWISFKRMYGKLLGISEVKQN